MNISKKHDYSISFIRMVSTIFIVTCHIMQYLNCPLAVWFNVGVQIFLCMSGFLYGKRQIIDDDISFIKKQFFKILLDYYIVIIPVIILLFVFHRDKISLMSIFKVLITYGTLPNGGHLWYIPYCLLCYSITPFLSRIIDKSHIVKKTIIISVFILLLTETFFSYFNSAWIICYILGFSLGKISYANNEKLERIISYVIVILAIISNSMQIVINYVLRIKFSGMVNSIYVCFCNYAHVALGISIFIAIRYFFTKAFDCNKTPKVLKKLCDLSDKYSYDVYLVHQFYIKDPFSLMSVTPILAVNILIILVCVIISSLIVHFISQKIKKIFFKC